MEIKFTKTWTGQGFIAGWLMGLLAMSLFQDWKGKDGYIEHLHEAWVDIHWAVWILPILAVVWWVLILIAREAVARGWVERPEK